MNDAIRAMFLADRTYYITEPEQFEPGEPAKQQCMPVAVINGEVFQLHQGNKLGAKLDPEAFRKDAIVLLERPKHKSIQACQQL